jgi:hypothetical protein
MCLKPIVLLFLVFPLVQSAQTRAPEQAPGKAEVCHTAPQKLEGGAIHILHVEALSSRPTDGTYANDGYGQGEFDAVRLLEVVKSPIGWTRGLVFRVHPFSGKLNAEQNLAPEHLTVGKRYYLVYTYHLDEEPHGDSDLIGLTRCSVHEDTLMDRKQLLSELTR